MTGERARVAQSPPPWRPGLPAVNRRFAVPSAYSFRLIGYGRRQRPCKAALSAHPCASPRPEGKRLSDLQPDQGIADSPQSFRKQLYCFCIKNYWGTLSPVGEGRGEGIRPHLTKKLHLTNIQINCQKVAHAAAQHKAVPDGMVVRDTLADVENHAQRVDHSTHRQKRHAPHRQLNG